MMYQRFLLICALLCSVFALPHHVQATTIPLSASTDSEDYRIDETDALLERQGSIITYLDKHTQQKTTAKLSEDGLTLIIYNPDGSHAVAERRGDGCIVFDGDPFAELLVAKPLTKPFTCVKIGSKRSSMRTNLSQASAALTIAGLIPEIPYSTAIAWAAALTQFAAQTIKNVYIKTIHYYCDTPSPRDRYVVNYYRNSNYTGLLKSFSHEVVFQNP